MSYKTKIIGNLKLNKNFKFDFSRIFNGQNLTLYHEFSQKAEQLIEENQRKIIQKINNFIQEQNIDRQNGQSYDEKIQFTRMEIFITLLMMYLNSFEKEIKREREQYGFYQINMEQIKYGTTTQAKEKLKCIHSYFINFYKNFIKTTEINECINSINKQIEECEQQQMELQKKIQQLQIQRQQILESNNQKEMFYNNEKEEIVEFIRRIESKSYDEIFKNNTNISQFELNQGRCEDLENAVIVDFADKNIGGLCLDTKNIAQEEILMLTHPEAIISMLFMRPIEDNEAVLIKNVIRFNDYQGYESSFIQKEVISPSFIKNHILCMDATCYRDSKTQFEQSQIRRELRKSYIAFSLALDQTQVKDISTGKWGCGIFNGDINLKFVIQLLAFSNAHKTSQQDRIIHFSSFHDEHFYNLIAGFKEDQKKKNKENQIHILFEYIKQPMNIVQQAKY